MTDACCKVKLAGHIYSVCLSLSRSIKPLTVWKTGWGNNSVWQWLQGKKWKYLGERKLEDLIAFVEQRSVSLHRTILELNSCCTPIFSLHFFSSELCMANLSAFEVMALGLLTTAHQTCISGGMLNTCSMRRVSEHWPTPAPRFPAACILPAAARLR